MYEKTRPSTDLYDLDPAPVVLAVFLELPHGFLLAVLVSQAGVQLLHELLLLLSLLLSLPFGCLLLLSLPQLVGARLLALTFNFSLRLILYKKTEMATVRLMSKYKKIFSNIFVTSYSIKLKTTSII